MKDFKRGLQKGLPIMIGYLSVSFTFGVKAVNGGIPPLAAILMSFTNLTSAGQFAGATLLMTQGGMIELILTTLVINIRYMLMSLALSQKITESSLVQRLLVGYGITDEIFAVASTEPDDVTPRYMYGLICLPLIGWTFGTALGAIASGLMPEVLSQAMELGLYAMFIAIIIPPAKKNKAIAMVILVAVILQCVFYIIPFLTTISVGFRIILTAVVAAALGALVFPITKEEEEND